MNRTVESPNNKGHVKLSETPVEPMSHADGAALEQRPSISTSCSEGLLLCLERFSAQAERHSKRTRTATCQDRAPSLEPRRLRAFSQQCKSRPCFGLRKQLQKLGRLIRHPASAARTTKRTSTILRQLWVGAFLPLASSRVAAPLRAVPSLPKGTNQSRVDRELCASRGGTSRPP